MNIDDVVMIEMMSKKIDMLKTAMKIASDAQMAQVAAGLIGDAQFIEDTAEISEISQKLCENLL